MSRWLAIVCLLQLLAGCAAWTLVGPERQSVAGGRYSVSPQLAWSRLKQGNVETWTVDGTGLQALYFFDPIADGASLFPAAGEQKLPAFASAMTPSEIEELVVHSVERVGGAEVRASGLRPTRLGRLDGFRFELEFLNASGLEMSGTVAGAVSEGTLLLIMYTGARAHYYPKYLSRVERVIESVQI